MIPHLALSKAELLQLNKLCKAAEEKGALTPAILKIIYREKWFKLFVPQSHGGLELAIPEALQYEESLAYIDGSLGWTVTLCAGANLFVGYIEKKKGLAVFSKSKVCFGGSGAATGIAEKLEDGYLVNGHWKYATGAPHLTHFTANCIIRENGKIMLNEDGSPLVRSFFFNRQDVTIYEDWHTMGLKATAGHSFSVNNLKLSPQHSFLIDKKCVTLGGRAFEYPFQLFAEITIAVNTLGMTRHFMDEAFALWEKRLLADGIERLPYNRWTKELSRTRASLEQLRNKFYEGVEQSWQELQDERSVTAKTQHFLGRMSRKMVKECMRIVAETMPRCGMEAARENSVMNRIFRDIFTASQHSLLTQ